MLLLSGLTKLFPITPTVKETGKSQKEADERYGEYEGTRDTVDRELGGGT